MIDLRCVMRMRSEQELAQRNALFGARLVKTDFSMCNLGNTELHLAMPQGRIFAERTLRAA
jgi:hypothetical protein